MTPKKQWYSVGAIVAVLVIIGIIVLSDNPSSLVRNDEQSSIDLSGADIEDAESGANTSDQTQGGNQSSSGLASSNSGSGTTGSSQGSGQQILPTRTLRPTSPPAPTSTPPPTKTPAPVRPAGNPMIAYALGDFDEAEIFILYVNTGKTVQITDNRFEDKAPSFSPDNKNLVYQSNRDQGWELYTYDLETGKEKRITTFNAEAKFPNWSPIPGDDRIVFEGRQGTYGRYDINVWMINADGTGMEQLTFSNADNRPIWSGDGSVIVFGRATKDSNNNGRVSSEDNLDIFTIDPKSKEINQITDTDNIDEFQFGSFPDGKQITFCAVSSDANNDGYRNLSDTRDLHFIDMNGSNRSTIKLNNYEIFSPDISPDGQFVSFTIWFNDDDSAIWLYNLATGDITELTGWGPYYHPEWSH
jgi:Tol biopolymer transport system component